MTNPEQLSESVALVALSKKEREEYPNIIYQEAGNAPEDRTILLATVDAVNQAGIALAVDLDFDQETGLRTAVVRTALDGRGEQRATSALIHGVTRAIDLKLEEQRTVEPEQPDVEQFALSAAQSLVGQMTGNQEIYNAFRGYYGGLRWGTDQERFVATLLAESVTYDPEVVEKTLDGSDVVHMLRTLDLELPYEQYKDWYDEKPADIFKQAPELDYHRLEDETFRSTPEGQKLEDAYRKMLGQKLAMQYKQFPREITDEGVEVPKPVIPLTKYPVIEALIADQASTSKPKAKYDFGASDVDELIVQTDSVTAQRALVESISTRLPKEDRYVFDGPNEFQHKRGDIMSLLRGYREACGDETRQAHFKDHLITILRAYTGDGRVASSVRNEWLADVASGRDWVSSQDVDSVKGIVSDIMTVGLASPDAEDFIAHFMPDFESGLVKEKDPLDLESGRMKLLVIDALYQVNEFSQPQVFERIGTRIFQDPEIGAKLKEFAELRAQAYKIFDQPNVLLARKAFGRHSFSLADEDDAEKALVRQALDEATAPAESLLAEARQGLNGVLLGYLNGMVDQGLLAEGDKQVQRLFKELVSRVNFGDTHHMETLPPEYTEIMKLADRPDVPDDQKSDIIWHFAQRFEYSGAENARLLMPAIIDMYRIVLGPVNSLRMPSPSTAHALSAINFIASHNKVFKFATQEDLMILTRYKVELAALLERVSVGVLPQETGSQIVDEEYEGYQKEAVKNIVDTVRGLKNLEEHYEKYLYIEDVKVKPNVYYPWLMEGLIPFWHKMQWEVSPGNSPKRDIQALHDVLKEHIDSLLVLHEGDYPEDFDVFEDGHLDSLLIECYERMNLNHDIQYNTTVWQDGLGFMHSAVALMPPKVIEQFKSKHGDDPRYERFIQYIEREHARWNKEASEE